MPCELCEHCQNPFSIDDKITMREGFRYHKRCHKCYVCSETNLQNAEVFKGVIFCNSCSQRIFQGCSTARRTKTLLSGRGKRPRSKAYRREIERVRRYDRKPERRPEWRPGRRPDRSRDGVIELARLAGSNSESDDLKEQKQRARSKSDHTLHVEKNTHVENCFYVQTMDHIKRASPEMGTTTDVTQELLRCLVPEYKEAKPKPCTPPEVPRRRRQPHTYKKKDIYEPIKNKLTCSDLRIAGLGISTEIANMALRKGSEFPVNIDSDTRFKGNTSYTLSVNKIKSDKSNEDMDWRDPVYSTIEESDISRNVMDRRLGSLLTMPLKLFKKHILTRSSLVSILMSDNRNTSIVRRIKRILHEEAVEHQARGLRKLYSTINRNNCPAKLGWIDLVGKVPRDPNVCSCSYGNRCKHYLNSHSYRCMRAQVMKLAGPTQSKLALYRHKVKRFIVPRFVRKIVTHITDEPAVKISAACQKSLSNKT